MFKSEKDNLIASILGWIAVLIIIYNAITFEPSLWFIIAFMLIMGIPTYRSIRRILKKDD
ncbi:hypothetical protein BN990_02289 [Virgibacillus salexigens]|uniref:Uncharacterized protein n=1 Tax=Virgibacillus massiliensis TaxID=1462526 RepID=A0A024QDH7_9BACI|nr:hypothetical protein BN990_02289 [Virgibacillus massiliensis]